MSYNDTLPTDKDKARALLGDTATLELLTDGHMLAVLALYAFNGGVAFMAEELAARFAQEPGDIGLPSGLRVSWRDRVSTWLALAAQMRSGGVVVGGAFSVSPPRTDGYAELAAEERA
jgi:hypothetical protein